MFVDAVDALHEAGDLVDPNGVFICRPPEGKPWRIEATMARLTAEPRTVEQEAAIKSA